MSSAASQLDERSYSITEVAERLKLHRNTVGRHVKDGRLRGYKVGRDYRIPESAIVEFLQRNDVPVRDSAHIIAIANQKGGVAKTTTAVNVAAALGALGQRVLLIDMDPQAGCSLLIGIQAHTLPRTIYHALRDETVSIRSIIQKTDVGFDLVPSNIYLSEAELTLNSVWSREYVLKRKLEPLHNDYDYIIIDTPPTLGILTINSLTAAQHVLIPAAAQYMSLQGLDLLLGTIDQVRRNLNSELTVMGILPTMYDRRTTHSEDIVDYFRTLGEAHHVLVYEHPIYAAVAIQRAPNEHKPLVLLDPKHEASRNYTRVAEEIIRVT